MMKFHISGETARMISANILGMADQGLRDELAAWLDACAENRAFYETVADPANIRRFIDDARHYDAGRGWVRVQEKRGAAGVRPLTVRRGPLRRLLPFAAATVAAACVTVAAVICLDRPERGERERSATAASAILPGGTKALLITETGEVFTLDAAGGYRNESFTHDGLVLDYAGHEPSAQAVMHTLRVPRGGEHRLVLSDGSRVWLNAGSELSYPSLFTDGAREVELSGEAYFIVASDAAHPFVVRSGDRTTTAVGTSFNVRTYDDYRTTLLTGRVSVSAGGDDVRLEPGQQAVAGANGMEVRQVSAADHISWKDGRFVYRSLPLREVMADMARWYDVDVSFDDARTANIRLTANIRKYEDLGSAIAIVEQAAYVDISVDGRSVTIRRK